MLVITRKAGQKLRIGDDVEISVLEVRKGNVKLGIKAPKGLSIYREEVYQRILEENKQAALSLLNSNDELDDMEIKSSVKFTKEKDT